MVRKGGGDPEPRFRTVVAPGEWRLDRTLAPTVVRSARAQQHYDFFQPLITQLIPGFADRAFQRFGFTDRFFPSRAHSAAGYGVALESDGGAWVSLYIQTEDKARTKRAFDTLEADRKAIESSISPGDDWHWLRHNPHEFVSISVRKDGTIDASPEDLEQTRDWMLDLLPKFKAVFDPRVKEILEESRPTNDG